MRPKGYPTEKPADDAHVRSATLCAVVLGLMTLGLASFPVRAAEIRSPYERAAAATDLSPHVDSTNQFVLLDTLIRFVPAARMGEKFPGPDDPLVLEWKGKFKDSAINFPDDGFRTEIGRAHV